MSAMTVGHTDNTMVILHVHACVYVWRWKLTFLDPVGIGVNTKWPSVGGQTEKIWILFFGSGWHLLKYWPTRNHYFLIEENKPQTYMMASTHGVFTGGFRYVFPITSLAMLALVNLMQQGGWNSFELWRPEWENVFGTEMNESLILNYFPHFNPTPLCRIFWQITWGKSEIDS